MKAFLLLVVFSAQTLAAEETEVKNAEADYFFARQSFVSWTASPINWFRGLQNARALNGSLTGSFQTPYPDGGLTFNTGKAMTIGLSTGQSTGMVSAGPSRVTAALEYIDSVPGLDSQSSLTSGATTRATTLDLSMSDRLRHYAFTYDHELYFASSRSALYGFGVWLGMAVVYDEYKMEQFRSVQNTGTIGTSTSLVNAPMKRSSKSYFFTTPSVLGLTYRKTLTDRFILDLRAGFLADAYGEAKVTYKGSGLSQTALTQGTSTTVVNLPAVLKASTRADLAGSTGYLWNLGGTFKLTDSIGIRAHVEDRMMKFKVDTYSITPDLSAISSSSLAGGANSTAALLGLLLPDLGPLPAEITDRRRSCGLEFQFWF